MRFWLWAACLLGLAGPVQAQFGGQTGALGSMVWSQRFQPAFMVQSDFQKFRYGAYGEGWLGNSDFALAGIFSDHGYISQATKERILDQMDGPLDIAGGYNLDLANVNIRIDSLVLSFGLSQSFNARVHLDNPNTLGLVLRGNAPYAGEAVTEDNLWALTSSTRQLSVGAGYRMGQLSLGGRLNFSQGLSSFNLEPSSFTIFTHEDGVQIDLDANYSLFSAGNGGRLFRFAGVGVGLDLGGAYQINDKMQADLSLTGASFLSWNGNQVSDEVSVEWEGISIASLLQDSVPLAVEQQVDSIKDQIFPDTTDAKWSYLNPGMVRLGFSYAVGMHGKAFLALAYAPGRMGYATSMPFISAGYQHEVAKGLVFGANAYYGGNDVFGAGLMGKYTIQAGSARINILAGGDNLLGLIASMYGRGFSVYGGLGVDL